MKETEISKACQTTVSAKAIRSLVDGNRLVLEPVEGAGALAGVIGKATRAHSVAEMKAAARDGMVSSGSVGLEEAI